MRVEALEEEEEGGCWEVIAVALDVFLTDWEE